MVMLGILRYLWCTETLREACNGLVPRLRNDDRSFCANPSNREIYRSLSVDEKPGVQLHSRKHKDRLMRRGRCKRIEFEYKRYGTRNIFCAFNIRDGHALVQVTRNRKFPAVAEFIGRIYHHYKRGPILIITDNINTRTGRNARALQLMYLRIRFATLLSMAVGSTK